MKSLRIAFFSFVICVFSSQALAQVTFNLPSLVCHYQPYTVTAQHGTINSTSYSWTASSYTGVAISHSMLATTIVLFSGPGNVHTLTVVVALSNGTAMATQVVTVIPNPTVQIVSPTTTLCEGATAVLTASGATQYTWLPGNWQTNTLTVVAGYYELYGFKAGCSHSTSITINEVNCVGIPEDHSGAFKIFPNPVKDELQIEMAFEQSIAPAVFDISGKKILSPVPIQKSPTTSAISLLSLPPGIYFIEFTDTKGTVLRNKFVKE